MKNMPSALETKSDDFIAAAERAFARVARNLRAENRALNGKTRDPSRYPSAPQSSAACGMLATPPGEMHSKSSSRTASHFWRHIKRSAKQTKSGATLCRFASNSSPRRAAASSSITTTARWLKFPGPLSDNCRRKSDRHRLRDHELRRTKHSSFSARFCRNFFRCVTFPSANV